MIRITRDDGRALAGERKCAQLAIGNPPFFSPATKRFGEGEGRKLYETLKRFVSSGDYAAIIVSNAPLFLASCPRTEAMDWISDHLGDNPDCLLILADCDEEVPEFQ